VIVEQVGVLTQLNKLSYFDVDTLAQIAKCTEKSLYENINRWLDKKYLLQLKKGLYVTSDYYSNVPDEGRYKEFIANVLRTPSYLSLEYVLQKYSLLTESVFVYTSITRKTTRKYDNDIGAFSYRKIVDRLFCGFTLQERAGYKIAEAGKSKALFDYMYLKFRGLEEISKDAVVSMRLNLDQVDERDIVEIGKFCEILGVKKYQKIPKLLSELKSNDI